jgi:hypothetical protein
MTATIVLPNDRKEAVLILEILKRFNVPVFKNGSNENLEADYIEEHLAILNERWEEINQPDARFYTLEDVDKLLKNKVNHEGVRFQKKNSFLSKDTCKFV